MATHGAHRDASLYTVRDSLHRSGEWLDGMGYALLAEEWREMRQAEALHASGAQGSGANQSG